MSGNQSEFNKALKSNIGKQMFTSIPFLIIQLSFVSFLQTIVFYIYEYADKGFVPLIVSISTALLYLLLYFILRTKKDDNYHSFFIFIILLSFYIIELCLFIIFTLPYLWVFLVITQILSGYFLLNNKYFYSMLSFLFLVYLFYIGQHLIHNFRIESLLVIIFAYMITFLIHKDRRNALLNLGRIYNSQKEINNRFEQLEENISQIFILCSYDFKEFYYISSAFERMFSIPRSKLIKNPELWIDFIHPGDKERIILEMEMAGKERNYRDFDLRTLYNNQSKWLNFQIFPIEAKSNGKSDRFAIIIDNISDNKLAELKLAEAKSMDAEFAARIQKNLLFSNPILNIQDLDVAAESIPSLSVGGDFFDFYRFSDEIVDVIIADVMGKGMVASLLGAASKSAFLKTRLDLTVLENEIPAIKKIMTLTNQNLSPELIQLGKFVTMQYGRLNMRQSIFTFIDSGHTSLLYYSSRFKCCWAIKGWNMPIGFNPDEEMVANIIPFDRNDLFFFYSDGVTETENEEGEQFGERRLNYILNNSAHLSSNQIMNKVRNLVFHYSSSEGFADDVTCIAMKIGDVLEKNHRVERIFRGTRESLKEVRTFIGSFLNEHCQNLIDEQKQALVLAVNEAAANIIEHNYEKKPELLGREILIEAGVSDSICFFQLYYDGEDFECTTFEAPQLNEFKSGGYGLFLMKEIMDSICYSTNIDGVQCLTLVKYL